jgi:hypothetical protein
MELMRVRLLSRITAERVAQHSQWEWVTALGSS